MIGIAPSRKRFDQAVEVLARLRGYDDRWQLSVKSKLPWELWWVWNNTAERAHYDAVFRRIHIDPNLRDAVVFDCFGPDVGSWLRRIGYVLSTSDDESFHLAPAEGMASRAVPALLPWPGADTIYDRRWIHADPPAMADALADLAADGWERAGEQAQAQVRAAYSLGLVLERWTGLLAQLADRSERRRLAVKWV
jgi:glycosyltransferase involved in cell wall biosynthesis